VIEACCRIPVRPFVYIVKAGNRPAPNRPARRVDPKVPIEDTVGVSEN
jgi:hypothetical protein